jgi:glycosyltransferase involved in cell wall biosynthesis
MNTADKPLVSVVMPVYNAEKYLAESIQSVLAQTYGNIEIVCVDDCSSDGSVAALETLAQGYDNVKVHALKANQGPSHARNFAIERARGEFILPLDADDLIDPGYCKLAMDVFREDPAVAVVYSRCKRFRDGEYWEWELPEYSRERMLAGNCVHVSAFYRKADWARIGGYDERLHALEDYDFWLHFTENGQKFHRIDRHLFFYRQHADDGHLIAAYDNGDRFTENTTNLRVWLNHQELFREFFSEMDPGTPDKIITTVKMNILGLIKIVEKRKKYMTSYRKTNLTVLGIPVAGMAWSDSKKKLLLFGQSVHTTRI